ncbi:MAG: acyl-CoA dehydratase activase, partial [Oscillospiraceae bacterium]|nr:acyl-CoA dehydratase activase [Oscillospiraceae bacterium]
MPIKIGIDIGSTTVKVVLLDEHNTLLYRAYARHYSKVREEAANQLRLVAERLKGQVVRPLITGSAGLGVSKVCDVPFVQEVYATAAAVRAYIPDTDAVIELGGEDAKIIFFGNTLEERMNGSCAGGTGSFIDQMATLLDVTVPELDALALRHEKIYPIASRCGVFAKSDIQPILNQGGRKEDIAASIYQAVVDQTVGGLTQGRDLTGKIAFLGGPLTFLQGLRDRFVESLDLDEDHALFPENADTFAAIGAALCTDKVEPMAFEELLRRLDESAAASGLTDSMEPLFADESEVEAFRTRHARATPEPVDAENYRGDAYLGIDAGSTTTKLVLITPQGGILYSYYGSNKGNPVTILLAELKNLYAFCGDRITIRASAVTGYGEDLIQNAFSIDLGLVETIAHYRAARHFNPQVDFIIDIGGQDMKCFKIRNGAVDSILLNEACSSGCGSFIETFAQALDYKIADFANLGILDQTPTNLGSRCTVFMNSSVKQAQKEGAGVESISAGLSLSVVKNAIYKVIRATHADDLGKHIVVQGGTFLNDAVLRGFEQEIGREVTRPTIAGLMGAYGAALSAKDFQGETGGLLDAAALDGFTHTSKPVVCNACTNRCSMTINTFDGERKFISGNRCNVPLGGQKGSLPNLMQYKYQRIRSLDGKGAGDGSRGKIGLPLGLNMYENLPFWFTLFTGLNFEIVLSPESTRTLYQKGQRTIPSDTVCYPAKLLHGHIEHLIDMGVEAIFYPCTSYNFDEGKGDNHYNCPVVAYYPELLRANMSRLKDVRFFDNYFGMHRPRDLEKTAARFFETEFGVPKKETVAAVRAAYRAYEQFRQNVRDEADRYIAYAREHGKRILVVAGRPYHIDPEINHGLDELI